MKSNIIDLLFEGNEKIAWQQYVNGITKTQDTKNFSKIGKALEKSHDSVRRELKKIYAKMPSIRNNLLKTVIAASAGKKGYIISDGTILKKEYAKKIEGVAKQHSGNKIVSGINLITTVWTDLEITLALDAYTWIVGEKDKIKVATEKIIDLAIKTNAAGVICDAGFATIDAIGLYIKYKIPFLMRIAANRNVTIKGFEDLKPLSISKQQALKLTKNNRLAIAKSNWNGHVFYIIAKKVKVGCSQWKILYFATTFIDDNELKFLGEDQIENKPKEKRKFLNITDLYLHRWKIEVFFRKAKQDFGLEDCLSRSIKHQETHALAVLIAYNNQVLLQKDANDKSSDNQGPPDLKNHMH